MQMISDNNSHSPSSNNIYNDIYDEEEIKKKLQEKRLKT